MALFKNIGKSMLVSGRVSAILQPINQECQTILAQRFMSSETSYNYETLEVTEPSKWVKQVQFNRPDALNAMNRAFWREMVDCFDKLSGDPDCRVVVITGAGRIFTAGLDLKDAAGFIQQRPSEDIGRSATILSNILKGYQQAFTSVEECDKPVIAAVHSGCVGGGVDLISACDIRFCTEDAWFQIKETDLGMSADLGTLQRFPKVIGNDSLFRELAYTSRRFKSQEAKDIGFVSRILPDKDALVNAAVELAAEIGAKSPIAVQGSKVNIIYSRDNSVPAALTYQRAWNAAMLQSDDLMKAAMAAMSNQTAEFDKM